MEIQAWFKIIGSESDWTRVLLEEIEYVADLKKAIKKKAAIKLNNYDAADLIIKATYNDDKDPKNAVELDPKVELHTVLEQVPPPVGYSTKKIRFFVMLPPPEDLPPPRDQIIQGQCIFKYGNHLRKTFYGFFKSEISLSSFVKIAKNLFTFPEGTKDSDITIELQDRKD
ncbi:hypothetical protein BDZ91DRAFT_793510 [Kalaharituber pfeilii]|nr:hypothetical protein BDZ91DRAFT_793510 [Kalaharituber pfeilii]